MTKKAKLTPTEKAIIKNCEKLKVGQSYKYKELCKILKIKESKDREPQYKALGRLVDYTKVGHSITIDAFKTMKEEKVDMRTNNKGGALNIKHQEDIGILLLDLLMTKEHNNNKACVVFPKNYLFRSCNLVNENYIKGYRDNEGVANALDMPLQAVSMAYDTILDRASKILYSALNGLKNKALVTWGHSYTVYTEVLDYDDNDKSYYKKVGNPATEQEQYDILTMERKGLIELDIKDKRTVIKTNNWEKYHAYVLSELQKEHEHIVDFTASIKIRFNVSDVALYSDTLEYKLKPLKTKVNREFLKSLKQGIDTTNTNNKKLLDELIKQSKHDIYISYKASETFVSDSKSNVDILVDEEADIVTRVNNPKQTKVNMKKWYEDNSPKKEFAIGFQKVEEDNIPF